MGKATNKIRFVRGAGGVVGFAIGVDVYRLQVDAVPAR
jgi:hypothetical protein